MMFRNTQRNSAGAIDWNEVKLRLEKTRIAIENLLEPDPDTQQQILRERAAVLAKSGAREVSPGSVSSTIEVLQFQVAGERYAFETTYISQVYPVSPITHIPGLPNFVVGIVAAQGDVLSVIDLRSLLELPISGLFEPVSIIALKNETMEFGILAEKILGIERFALESIDRELPTLTSKANNYLQGVSTSRTAILNAGQILSDPRLVIEVG